jgi:phosphoribosylanthranilate isomerase
MNIKVCGITTLKQLQQLDGLNIDFAGLNFYEPSPRYVGEGIDAEALIQADLDVKTVGIFVDDDYETVMEKVEKYELHLVQLHGNESPELCKELSEDTEVIKVFAIDDSITDIDELVAPYDAVCDYYLFDTASEGKGGSGKKFNWDLLSEAKIEKPFFISGGIALSDTTALKNFKHPDFYGVDINSQFEKSAGVKDMATVLEFKLALK